MSCGVTHNTHAHPCAAATMHAGVVAICIGNCKLAARNQHEPKHTMNVTATQHVSASMLDASMSIQRDKPHRMTQQCTSRTSASKAEQLLILDSVGTFDDMCAAVAHKALRMVSPCAALKACHAGHFDSRGSCGKGLLAFSASILFIVASLWLAAGLVCAWTHDALAAVGLRGAQSQAQACRLLVAWHRCA